MSILDAPRPPKARFLNKQEDSTHPGIVQLRELFHTSETAVDRKRHEREAARAEGYPVDARRRRRLAEADRKRQQRKGQRAFNEAQRQQVVAQANLDAVKAALVSPSASEELKANALQGLRSRYPLQFAEALALSEA